METLDVTPILKEKYAGKNPKSDERYSKLKKFLKKPACKCGKSCKGKCGY